MALVFRAVLVALLAEGVDRNFFGEFIEELPEVALLAEGVDRNIMSARSLLHELSRPPRGGRG